VTLHSSGDQRSPCQEDLHFYSTDATPCVKPRRVCQTLPMPRLIFPQRYDRGEPLSIGLASCCALLILSALILHGHSDWYVEERR